MSRSKPTVKKVPWGLPTGVLYAIILFYFAQIAAGLLLLAYPLLAGWSEQRIDTWLTGNIYANFGSVALTHAVTLAGLSLFLKVYKQKIAAIGLLRPKRSDVGWAFTTYALYFVAYVAVFMAVYIFVPGINTEQEQQTGFNGARGLWPLAAAFMALVVLAPIVEEILVRGLIFTSFRKHISLIWATLATSALFAVAHLPAGGAEGPLYIAAIDTFVLSIFLCALREKTGSLWAGIYLHAIKNFVAYYTLFIAR